MNDIKEIGERLKGLRESLDLTVEEFANSCDIPYEEYCEYETGGKDFSITILKKIGDKYNVDITTLMFDDEPRMSSYFLTRKGKGLEVKRVEDYKYRALASGFANRKADIFMVTVEPRDETIEIHQNSHIGQEFNLVIEGRMLIQLNGKDHILGEGDSLYFDSSLLHGMRSLDGKRVKFLAVVL